MKQEQPDWLNVSRETFQRLQDFAELVKKWNPAINLVSKSSLADLWSRHILDSCQVYQQAAVAGGSWVDLGSGGGFPGLVVAILRLESDPELRVTLVEVDRRKSVFLSQAARQLDLKVDVISERIEAIAPLGANVLTARALAPLDQLCGFAHKMLIPEGVALFQKGATFQAELDEAKKSWAFEVEVVASKVDPSAVILKMEGFRHV
jgi:16S rRNA (guanine527-N7)-methyltransferase